MDSITEFINMMHLNEVVENEYYDITDEIVDTESYEQNIESDMRSFVFTMTLLLILIIELLIFNNILNGTYNYRQWINMNDN